MGYRIRTPSERVARTLAGYAVGRGIYFRSWQDRAGYWTFEVRRMAVAERMANGVDLEGPKPSIEYVTGSPGVPV